jgi:uncharacterized membrane protein (UPF0127 family)
MRIKTERAELVMGERILISELIVAEKMLSRMVGLLGRRGLQEGSAMLINPCGSIHTVGMRFSLDLIFIDKRQRVVRIICGVRPNRFVLGGRGAKSVVEIESGWFDMSQIGVGDEVNIRRI